MGVSAKIVARKPARTDGTNSLRLQVILNREVLSLKLDVNWPAALVDEKAGACLTKLIKNQQLPGYEQALAAARDVFGETWQDTAEEYTLVLKNALGKANKIFTQFRLGDLPISRDGFEREYHTGASRGDFLLYMERVIEERRRQGKASMATWKNNRSTYNSLKAFRKQIPFDLLTPRFADEYEAWLIKQGMTVASTRFTRHKDVKTFLQLARLDKLKFEDPYAHFKLKMSESTWKPLRPEELAKLEAYYELTGEGTTRRRILQKFLFSCYSSLRLGDLNQLHLARLDGNELHIKHQKGKRFEKRENIIPLTQRALYYLAHGTQESGRQGFYPYSDQASNRTLQEIGRALGIDTKVHFHIGRETFGTNYMRDGGQLHVLQKIMNHSKIEMTMRYVHTDLEMKRADIERLDKIQQARLSKPDDN